VEKQQLDRENSMLNVEHNWELRVREEVT